GAGSAHQAPAAHHPCAVRLVSSVGFLAAHHLGLLGVPAMQPLQIMEGRKVRRFTSVLLREGAQRTDTATEERPRPALVACWIAVCVALAHASLVVAPVALATTTVTGVGNPSVPLVIDPGSTRSAVATDDINLNSGAVVAWISDMPDTRDVGKITIGAF